MVVPGTDVLEILHKLADEARHHNMESVASKFWQIWLQYTFPLAENYLVTCEQPPDDSRRRVDIKVEKFEHSDAPFSLVVLVEVKRKGASVKELEKQAVDAGKKALDEYGYNGVYLLTALGLGFRFWYMGKDHVLEPMEGESSPGSTRQKGRYRDVLDPEVNKQWWLDVEMLKEETPTGIQMTLPIIQPASTTAQVSYSTSTWAGAEQNEASSTVEHDQAWPVGTPEQTGFSAYSYQSTTTEAGPSQSQGVYMQQTIDANTVEPQEDTATGEGSNQPPEHTTHQGAPASTGDDKQTILIKNILKYTDKKGKEYYNFAGPDGERLTTKVSAWHRAESDKDWKYYETERRRFWVHKDNIHKHKR